ncbi:ATP-binding SpoIIE family protein phosphatase [uncultured Pseudacidovorax sp.]|uniref:ATP-binding SpoIIE family protein phosphatase n=1 Tax=uncultured Pseudacidovorax sp. TaxID=679313 RepID=UPI0025EFE65E|nr:ATP-binding SpoIIE family protein phosphatase [uncultured Pseudacidovorax sp.]
MEVIRGWTHRAFPIEDLSFVGEARRHVARLAAERDWPEHDAARAALVTTELGTNLAKHAQAGQLLVAARDALGDIELIAVDRGPGIPDLPRSMRDGYSTSATAGTGLGAIARQSEVFDAHSAPGVGTVCLARLRPRCAAAPAPRVAVDWGAVCVPVRGETACGDGWMLAFEGRHVAALVADGLGHGPEAQAAADTALDVFERQPFDDGVVVMQCMHDALRTTRGAAVFGMWIDGELIRYTGAGNVAGRLVSGTADKALATAHGTLGLQVRRFDMTHATRPPHALALLHSDGVQTRWPGAALAPLLGRDPTLLAARIFADYARGRDDACIVVLRPEEGP